MKKAWSETASEWVSRTGRRKKINRRDSVPIPVGTHRKARDTPPFTPEENYATGGNRTGPALQKNDRTKEGNQEAEEKKGFWERLKERIAGKFVPTHFEKHRHD